MHRIMAASRRDTCTGRVPTGTASPSHSVPGPARIEFSIWLQAPSRDLGPNEGASFSRAIEITAAVLSLCGVAADNMTLVSYQMPFCSTGIMSGGSNALFVALHR